MIRSLTIRNFQAHRRLKIRLDKWVTTIVGPSDVGKSAVVRALRWLSLNRPQGMGFVRHGTKAASVTVRTHGRTVRRTRGDASNTYTLGGKGKHLRLQAFGSGVPTEVQDLLKVSELNFQRQHDAPFWFSLSPGEVSKQLNDIINLRKIDTTLAHINARLRKSVATHGVCKDRLHQYREKRRGLVAYKEADRVFQSIERDQRQLQDAKDTHDEVLGVCSRVVELRRRFRGIKQVLPKMEVLLKMANECEVALDAVEQMSDAIENVARASQSYDSYIARRNVLSRDVRRAIGEVCPLCQQPVSRDRPEQP